MKLDELGKVKLIKCEEGYKLDVKYKKKFPYKVVFGFAILILFILDECDIIDINVLIEYLNKLR